VQLAAVIPIVYVLAVTPVLVAVDLREHRLPNAVVLPGIAVGLVGCALQWSLVPLIAGAAYGGFLLLLSTGGGIGMGDVKLGAMLGLASPTLEVAALAPLAAFLLGGVAASVALVRHGARVRIAFGPWMLGGYGVALLIAGSSITGTSP
jgi:leader peptidase (prepilin peptidase) / N-methyltransferase